MANKHSELIGSFLRRGTFPLEADYIFDSYDALKEFYEKEENYAILHKGLFKIVSTEEEQTLYWCVKKEDKLIFKPLISEKTLEELQEKIKDLEKEISDLNDKLDKEIADRKEADFKIWGTLTPEDLDEEYNSIAKLIDKLKEAERIINLHQEKLKIVNKVLNSIIGTSDKTEEELLDYLNNDLDWKSLTIINDFLTYFWDEDPDRIYENVKNWSHLNDLFENLDTSKSLEKHFYDLWVKIMGDANPNKEYDTLMKIKTHIEDVNKKIQQNLDEINAIESSVGLHATGQYKSDPSTKHIQNATSVMDALAKLDSLIDKAINNQNIEVEDSSSIDLTIHHYNEKNVLQGDVKISSEDKNILLVKNDGLWSAVSLNYNKGQLSLLVNGEVRDTYNLGLSGIVKQAKYNPDTESIEITFKTLDEDQMVSIHMGSLINEWTVDNSIGNDVVVLTKTRKEGQGTDTLSADVRIYENDYNILTRKEKALYVDGRTSNIKHEGQLLDKIIDDLITNKTVSNKDIENLKKSVTDLEKEVTGLKKDLNDLDTKYALKYHTHTISDIVNLQSELDKLDKLIQSKSKENTDKITDLEKETTEIKKDIEDKYKNTMVYKGSVDDLPKLDDITEKKIGDVYNIKTNNSKYIWTGEGWECLSEDMYLYWGGNNVFN